MDIYKDINAIAWDFNTLNLKKSCMNLCYSYQLDTDTKFFQILLKKFFNAYDQIRSCVLTLVTASNIILTQRKSELQKRSGIRHNLTWYNQDYLFPSLTCGLFFSLFHSLFHLLSQLCSEVVFSEMSGRVNMSRAAPRRRLTPGSQMLSQNHIPSLSCCGTGDKILKFSVPCSLSINKDKSFSIT